MKIDFRMTLQTAAILAVLVFFGRPGFLWKTVRYEPPARKPVASATQTGTTCVVEPTSVGLLAVPTQWEPWELVADTTCAKYKKFIDSLATIKRVEFQREFRRKNPH